MSEIILKGKKGEYSFSPYEKSNQIRLNGRFSIIYKGTNLSTKEAVVVKMLHPKLENNSVERKKFVREFVLAPNNSSFVKTLDICESGIHLYIIREYLYGADLGSYSQNSELLARVKSEGKEKIIGKILDAFIHLHQYEIIHGDVKPSNIFLIPSNGEIQIKLIDSGLSISFHHNRIRDKNNPIPFSLIYASPEVMLNYPELISTASEIFSLSLSLYEFLTNEKPVDISYPALMMSLMLNEPLSYHRNINSKTLEVLNKAAFKFKFPKPIQNYPDNFIRKSLNDAMLCRYQNMNEFKTELMHSFSNRDSIWMKLWK